MRQEWHEILRILEAPLADIQSVQFPTHEFVRVKRGIPGLKQDVPQNDMLHITISLGFRGCYAGARWEASDRSRGMHDQDERAEWKAPGLTSTTHVMNLRSMLRQTKILDPRAVNCSAQNEAESNRIEIRYKSWFEYFYKSPLRVILLNYIVS